MRHPIFAIIASLFIGGCDAAGGIEDGDHDDFLDADGKSDSGIVEGSSEAWAVLWVASTYSNTKLDNDVGLTPRVAANIVAFRAGDDEKLGTRDDLVFETLRELDGIVGVGPKVFAALLEHAISLADSHPEIWCSLTGSTKAEEREPNDNVSLAHPLWCSDNEITGFMQSIHDVDIYTVTIPAKGALSAKWPGTFGQQDPRALTLGHPSGGDAILLYGSLIACGEDRTSLPEPCTGGRYGTAECNAAPCDFGFWYTNPHSYPLTLPMAFGAYVTDYSLIVKTSPDAAKLVEEEWGRP